jgi:tetratricopeptide (TPR) repeat protein
MHLRRGGEPSGRARPHVGRQSAHRRTRRSWLAVVAVVAAVLAYGVAVPLRRAVNASRLPSLPDLSAQPAAVRDHLRDSDAAARRDPSSESAVSGLCLALHADMYLDQADRCYRIAESLGRSNWEWTYYRALILSERGGGRDLVDALRSVLAKAPAFGPAWLRLGDAEFKEGQYERASDAWTRAIAAQEPDRGAPEGPTRAVEISIAGYASLGLARIALAQNRHDEARQILEPLTQRSPRFGSAYRLLAESDAALARRDEAGAARARADHLPAYAPYADPMIDRLARESRNSTFLLRQASEADLASNGEWAEYLTRRALAFDPENPDVLAKRGRVLRNLQRNAEALDVFLAYTRKVPEDFQGLAQIGSCLTDLRRFVDAESYLRRALTGLDDALTHYNLAVVLAATDRPDEGILEYHRALDRDPALIDARNNLAAVLARQGKMAEAKRELDRVLAIDPENVLARANLEILSGKAR